MMRGQCCVLHDAHLFLFFALLLVGSSGVSAFTITRTVRVPGDCSGAAWEALDPELVVSQHQIRPVAGESLSYTVPAMASKCRILLVGGGGAGGSYTGVGSRGGGSGEVVMLDANATPGESFDFVITGGTFSYSKTPLNTDPLDGYTITLAGITANGGKGGRPGSGGGDGFSGGGGTGLKSPSPAYNNQLKGGSGGLNGLNGGVLSGGQGVGSTAEVLTCVDDFLPPRPPSFLPAVYWGNGGSAQCPILAGRLCGGSGGGGVVLRGYSYIGGGSTYDSALNTLGWGPGSAFNYGGSSAGGGGGGGSYDTTLARTSQGGYGAPPQAFVQCFRDPAFNLCDATVPAGHTKVSSQLFTADGTFTAPAGASDMKLRVLAMGGGGGAGASYNVPGAYSGWLKSAVINNVSPGQQFPVTVGQGGASCINVCGGGSAPNYHAGNPGGSSSFGSFVAEGGHAVVYSGQEHKRAMGSTAGGTGSSYRWNFQSTGPETGPSFYAGDGGSNGGNGGLGTYNQNSQILPGHGPFDACLSSFTDHVFTPGPGGKGADVSEPLVMPDNTQGNTYLLAGGGGAGGVLIDGQGPVAGNGNNGGGSIKGKYYNISGSGGVGYGAGGGAGGYGCETNPNQSPFSNAAGGAGAPGFVFVEVYIPTLATTAAAPATTTAGPATTTAGPATTTAVPATTTDVPGSSASTDGSVAKDEAAGSSSGFGIDWIIIAAAAGACCCCCILIIVAVAVIRKRRSKERDDLDLDPGSVPMSAVGSIGPSGFSTPLSPDEHYQAISGNVTPHKTIGTTGYDAYEHSHAGSVSSPPAQKGSHASRILARNLSSKSLIDHKELQFGGQLGEGSYGVVYRGTWRNQEVAVKMVKNDAGVTDASQISEALIDEFAEESELMANLRPHTNVCLLLGITVEPNLCIVTELYPNGCVYDYCEKHGRFSRADVYNILKGVAGGLSHLHSEGVVHRDLAARNILLAQGLVPKIADFGMSRVLDQGEGSAGQTKSNTGPLKWMAPECLVHHEYSTKSDVWAYGVCMFEVTTAQDPYPGEAPIRVATLVSHNELQLRLPDDLLAEYDSVQQAMAWCMAFLANDRPDMNTVFGHMSSLS